MARIGVAVVKAVSFRGVQQEFSNVYHFTRPLPTVDQSERDAIIDEIVALEKSWHSSDVTFKRAQLWSASGTKAENEMLRQRTLSGTGASSSPPTVDRERAVLIRWPAGKDRRGNPVYLRKYFHICGNWKAIVFSSAVLQNTAEIASADRTSIATDANGLKVVGATVDTWTICAASGREVTGDAECHRYFEHHQLGDMWR